MKKYFLFLCAVSSFFAASAFAETKTVYVSKHFERQIKDDGTIIDKIFVYDGGVSGTKIATVETTRRENEEPVTRTIYHHEDHLTGANVDTDEDGQVMQLLDYYPYGETRIDEHDEDYHDDYQFTGKERDEETGLSYYELRFYNSAIARFMSRDPWGGDIRDPQSLNKYSYVQNNPLKYTDPTGATAELAARPTWIKDGLHMFYLLTPDHPEEIDIPGIPKGTEQFTIGAYNRGGFMGIGNKLVPEIGYEGGNINTDTPYLQGKEQVTDKKEIQPPKGQNDSQLINNLGKEFYNIPRKNYFFLGQRRNFDSANSNNFVHELGSRTSIADQVSSFNPKGHNWVPGQDRGFLKTSSGDLLKKQTSTVQNHTLRQKEKSQSKK